MTQQNKQIAMATKKADEFAKGGPKWIEANKAPIIPQTSTFKAMQRASRFFRPAPAFTCVQEAWLYCLYVSFVLPSLWNALMQRAHHFHVVLVVTCELRSFWLPFMTPRHALHFLCFPLYMTSVHHFRSAMYHFLQFLSTAERSGRQRSSLRSTCLHQLLFLHLEFDIQGLSLASAYSTV